MLCLSSRNMIDKTMCEVLWRNISDFYVNLTDMVLKKTVDTHKILINAIQFYVVFKKYDRQLFSCLNQMINNIPESNKWINIT
jgi:hypothetical protein